MSLPNQTTWFSRAHAMPSKSSLQKCKDEYVFILVKAYLMSVCPAWNTKCSSQAKICQLNGARFVNEQILWFQITMEHSALVAELNSLKNLMKIALKEKKKKSRILKLTLFIRFENF